jgi:LPS export ABC transporter protein LptC
MIGIRWNGLRWRVFEGPRRKKRIAAAIFLLVMIAAVGALWGLRETSKGGLKILLEHTDLDVKDVLFTEVGASGEKWEIRAQRARYFRKENKALFDHADIRLVLKDGKVFRVRGDRGSMDTSTRDMEISGNVAVESDGGDRFTTDRLQYSHAKGIVSTDDAVVLENARMRIDAVGMRLSLLKKEVSLLARVRADVR